MLRENKYFFGRGKKIILLKHFLNFPGIIFKLYTRKDNCLLIKLSEIRVA